MNGADSDFFSNDGDMSSLDQFLVLVRKRVQEAFSMMGYEVEL